MARNSILATAQHEAAHVVVGVACGLHLRRAVVGLTRLEGTPVLGYSWFDGRRGAVEAWGLMFAAGVAWERAAYAGDVSCARLDVKGMRYMHLSPSRAEPVILAAAAMLTTMASIHTRVTRALLDGDLSGEEVLALARGERLRRDD